MNNNKVNCKKCNRLISTSNIKKHELACTGIIKNKFNKFIADENGKVTCPYCNKLLSKYGIHSHINVVHLGIENIGFAKLQQSYRDGTRTAWNKGLTAKSDERVNKCRETFLTRIQNGEIDFSNRPPISDETKLKISESMKKAHKEGRAWNIGKSRWNNEPSYPEKFFMQVIENEFKNKEYEREYPVHIYSIDFAWTKLKKAIEIDGDQHQRFKEYIDRDNRKDECLKSEGWEILRLSWKEFMRDTKGSIEKAKRFIEQ